MEILSTGEKIKRTRIYKGITLKELCDKEISISKMSCIENGKVKPDEHILRYIAKKIKVDYEYLSKDVYEQIIDNLNLLDNEETFIDYEKGIKINLSYALEYEYNDLAFELTHRLFNYYINIGEFNEIPDIIPSYYNLYISLNTINKTIIYYKDLAKYLYINKEYREAGTYYGRIRELLKDNDRTTEEEYLYINFKEAKCLFKIDNISLAKIRLDEVKKNIENVIDNNLKGDVYRLYSTIQILENIDESNDIEQTIKWYGDNELKIANARLQFSLSYFKIHNKFKALENIKQCIAILSENLNAESAEIFIKCIKALINNKEYKIAEELIDRGLDIAIELDKIKIIQESYYLKGMLLQLQGNTIGAEMYMNLSLDALMKYGNKDELYSRYIEIANMYYKSNDIKDSIRYFTLAMKLKNKDV